MVGNLDKPGVGGGSFSCRKKKIKTEVLFLGQCFALESNLLWYYGTMGTPSLTRPCNQ